MWPITCMCWTIFKKFHLSKKSKKHENFDFLTFPVHFGKTGKNMEKQGFFQNKVFLILDYLCEKL